MWGFSLFYIVKFLSSHYKCLFKYEMRVRKTHIIKPDTMNGRLQWSRVRYITKLSVLFQFLSNTQQITLHHALSGGQHCTHSKSPASAPNSNATFTRSLRHYEREREQHDTKPEPSALSRQAQEGARVVVCVALAAHRPTEWMRNSAAARQFTIAHETDRT